MSPALCLDVPSRRDVILSRPKNRYYDPTKPNRGQEGFRNKHDQVQARSLAEVLRWRWNASRYGLPRPPRETIPRVTADLEFIHANAIAGAAMQPAVTWIGHATVLAQLSGLNLLTDPIFSDRASPMRFLGPKRHQPPGVAINDLPRIDLVVVSHSHYDHLDQTSIRCLNAQEGGPPLFLVPLGLKRWLQRNGVSRAVELDWWESQALSSPAGKAEVFLLPSRHWSARGLHDRMLTLWGGFGVFAPDCHLFYAGDTSYSRDFADIRHRLLERQVGGGFDIAILPIGAYEPRWFMADQHVNVHEAVKIHSDLGAKRSLGVHWGTFELTDEPLDEPPRQLLLERSSTGLSEEDFFVLAIGETRRLPPRS